MEYKTYLCTFSKFNIFFFHTSRGRKMNAGLEKAIQEDMMELDRMTDD